MIKKRFLIFILFIIIFLFNFFITLYLFKKNRSSIATEKILSEIDKYS